jgi:hypothetical protein
LAEDQAGHPRFVRTTLTTLLLALLVAGCSAGDREQEVSQRASGFLTALAQGDTGTACSLLTPQARDNLATSAGSSCAQAFPTSRIHSGKVQSVHVWADRAMVATDAGSVFLAEFTDGWRVTAAGCTSRGESMPYLCVVSD